MIEELMMAVLMTLVFAVATFYLCEVRGSFALFWLVYAVSLADGIGTRLLVSFVGLQLRDDTASWQVSHLVVCSATCPLVCWQQGDCSSGAIHAIVWTWILHTDQVMVL